MRGHLDRSQFWSENEEKILYDYILKHGDQHWTNLVHELPYKTLTMCQQKWQDMITRGIRKGNWTIEEDRIISQVLIENPETKWSDVANRLYRLRTGKQCRERWTNHLDPQLKKSPWTDEEDEILIEMQAMIGNYWTRIAQELPGRSENEVKNRWYSTILRKNPEIQNIFKPSLVNNKLYTKEEKLVHQSHLSSLSSHSSLPLPSNTNISSIPLHFIAQASQIDHHKPSEEQFQSFLQEIQVILDPNPLTSQSSSHEQQQLYLIHPSDHMYIQYAELYLQNMGLHPSSSTSQEYPGMSSITTSNSVDTIPLEMLTTLDSYGTMISLPSFGSLDSHFPFLKQLSTSDSTLSPSTPSPSIHQLRHPPQENILVHNIPKESNNRQNESNKEINGIEGDDNDDNDDELTLDNEKLALTNPTPTSFMGGLSLSTSPLSQCFASNPPSPMT